MPTRDELPIVARPGEGVTPVCPDEARPRTLQEMIGAMPSEVRLLRDALQSRGAAQVGARLGRRVAEFVEHPQSDWSDTKAAALLGRSMIGHLVQCRGALDDCPELRHHLGSQMGRMVAYSVSRLEGARQVRVEVATDAAGDHTVQFGSRKAVRAIPLHDIDRVYDWGTVPVSRERTAGELLSLRQARYLRDAVAGAVSRMRRIARSEMYRRERGQVNLAGWVQESEGSLLELLMRDCLCDSGLPCCRALMDENILEATDLRVRLPGLRRRHGERVQVSRVSDFGTFRRKRRDIPYAITVIFLCPLSLARSWLWDADDSTAAEPEMTSHWRRYLHSPQRREDERTAEAIKSQLLQALSHQPRPFLGPAELVPPGLRDLIGEFVRKEGRRCHQRLRSRQEKRPSWGSSPEHARDRMFGRRRDARMPRTE